ncbi:hypothetical protein [Escherichia coli]
MKKINKKAIPFQKYSTHGDSVIFRLLKLKNKLEEKLLENKYIIGMTAKEGANKWGNSSRLTQSFHFFMFEPIFSPVNALNQPI